MLLAHDIRIGAFLGQSMCRSLSGLLQPWGMPVPVALLLQPVSSSHRASSHRPWHQTQPAMEAAAIELQGLHHLAGYMSARGMQLFYLGTPGASHAQRCLQTQEPVPRSSLLDTKASRLQQPPATHHKATPCSLQLQILALHRCCTTPAPRHSAPAPQHPCAHLQSPMAKPKPKC